MHSPVNPTTELKKTVRQVRASRENSKKNGQKTMELSTTSCISNRRSNCRLNVVVPITSQEKELRRRADELITVLSSCNVYMTCMLYVSFEELWKNQFFCHPQIASGVPAY